MLHMKWLWSLSAGALVPFLLLLLNLNATAQVVGEGAEVVVIMPNRKTPYNNAIHNGMLFAASNYEISMEIQDVGNYDAETSRKVMEAAIAKPSEEQPKLYIIWPIDLPTKELLRDLYQRHGVPIIQLNQLPGDDTQWEWESIIAYAGPSDAERARNAGIMMIEAFKERGIEDAKVVALGYPASYGGYHLSIKAFQDAIDEDDGVTLAESFPLEISELGRAQNAYNAMVSVLDDMARDPERNRIHGVYAMDDDLLAGGYQAIADRGMLDEITLVGTVCNGARSLLEVGSQYGTTVQSPFLEAVLAMDMAKEFLTTGNVTGTVQYIPNPPLTGTEYQSSLISFLNETYVVDDLCTWSLEFQRAQGIKDIEVVSTPQDICNWNVECLYIPTGLFIAGYTMAGINYAVAFACAIGIYFYRNKKVVQLAQPAFIYLILLGTAVDTSSIIFMSTDNRSSSEEQLDAFCVAWPWLLSIGQMMTTATLIAKMYRVKAVTVNTMSHHAGVVRRAQVRPIDVSYFIIGGVAVDILLLGLWFGLEGFHWIIQVVSTDGDGFVLSARGECSSEGERWWIYPVVIMVFHFGMLVYGNYLAYATRKFHQVSDSKWVAISLFNSIQLLLVVAVMLGLSDDNVSISYVVRASYAFLNNIGVLLLIVAPKVLSCIRGQGDVLPDIYGASRNAQGKSPVVSGVEQPRVSVSGLSPVSGTESPAVDRSTSFADSPTRNNTKKETAGLLVVEHLMSMEEETRKKALVSLCSNEEQRDEIISLLDTAEPEQAQAKPAEKRSGWGASGFSLFSEHEEDKQSGQHEDTHPENDGGGGHEHMAVMESVIEEEEEEKEKSPQEDENPKET